MSQPLYPYEQLANDLRAMIQSGQLKPGDQLPSRRELGAKYGVSDQVVGGAMRVLRAEKLIVTLLGSGVYVAEPPPKSGAGRPDTSDDDEPAQVAAVA